MKGARLQHVTLCPDSSVIEEIGDWSATPGSEPWCKALRSSMRDCVEMVGGRPEQLKHLVAMSIEHEAWTKLLDRNNKPFATFEQFCSTKQPHGLGTPFEELKPYIVAACGGSEVAAAAITTRAEAAPTHADTAKRLVEKGRKDFVSPSVSVGDDGNQRSLSPESPTPRERGNAADYLAARIARDAPEVHEAMKAGKYPSVRAAAVAAGIVKPIDPFRKAQRTLSKLSRDELVQLRTEIDALLAREAAD